MSFHKNHNIAALRKNYQLKGLDLPDLHDDPMTQFSFWFDEALKAEITEPNAMVLSTVSSEGVPSSRTVLLKGTDEKSFHFYTNYNSEKGTQISENNNVSLLFLWLDLERQVRITGEAYMLPKEDSLHYFRSRPVDSQIGAWASNQSMVIPSREYLEKNFTEMKNKFKNDEIPLPLFWGGYKVIPSKIEFWQGRQNRLHDRFLYTKLDENNWKIERLSP
ncbi:pyridoxamine 5'-phosphate oxidase [Ignavibacteriales bacterium]